MSYKLTSGKNQKNENEDVKRLSVSQRLTNKQLLELKTQLSSMQRQIRQLRQQNSSLRRRVIELEDEMSEVRSKGKVKRIAGPRRKRQRLDESLEPFGKLPLELLEMVLMKTTFSMFVILYKMPEAEQLAYLTLSSVSLNWWQTINGWPGSNTRRWFKHETRRQLERLCRPFSRQPVLEVEGDTDGVVLGITQLDNEIYVIGPRSDKIKVFTSSFRRIDDIRIEGLKEPWDIAVCKDSRVIYVADWSSKECIWRVTSLRQVSKFLTDTEPYALSVTSRRLLVTSSHVSRLRMFDSDGTQLKVITFPDYMRAHHAIETADETFIISHSGREDGRIRQYHRVSEVDVNGNVIRVCDAQLYSPEHVALHTDGRVIVADYNNHRVVLLSRNLQLERVLLDKERHELRRPYRLCYLSETGRLLIGQARLVHVKVYNLSREC